MVGRLWWTLARDNATPFARFFSRVNIRLSCPVESTIFCAVLCTAFGAIQLGSKTAFTDLVGSFIILTTTSYFLAFFPHLLSGRNNVPPGPFWMGRWGFLVNGIACTLIVFFNIFFCFPYAYPVSPISVMNCKLPKVSAKLCTRCSVSFISPFTDQILMLTINRSLSGNSVILVGCVFLTVAWWLIHGTHKYPGPKLTGLYIEDY